jgi:RND family efflux transporter MFP subunit
MLSPMPEDTLPASAAKTGSASPPRERAVMETHDVSRLSIDRSPGGPGRRGGRRAVGLLALGAAVAAAVLYLGGWVRPALSVPVATVSAYHPSEALTLFNASGYVVAQRRAAVASKVTSRLEALEVEEGSPVRSGQVIARLESEDTRAALERARAEVDVARATEAQGEADLREATLSYERTRELLRQKLAAQSAFDTAEARYRQAMAGMDTARARLRAAVAALAEAQVQVDYTVIRAPFDGVVLTKNADVGDIVTPLGAAATARASVVTLADLGSLQVEADVSESNIGQVRVGQPAEVHLDALPGERFPARVHMIVPTADRSKASVLVKVALEDHDPRVLPEMSAKVAFLARPVAPDERAPVAAVPATALVNSDTGTVVYAVRVGHARAVAVQAGRTFGELREVTAGLDPGERVVSAPPPGLADGARVEPQLQ